MIWGKSDGGNLWPGKVVNTDEICKISVSSDCNQIWVQWFGAFSYAKVTKSFIFRNLIENEIKFLKSSYIIAVYDSNY